MGSRKNRLAASLTVTGILLLLLASSARAASPPPTPSLERMLVAPNASSYVEEPQGQHDGPFSAADYAGSSSQTLDELHRDGFVAGYVRTWVDDARKHLIVEEVIAFGGRRDAAKWLGTVKQASSDQYYVRAIAVDGVDSYFGRHYADPSQPAYSDVGVFLKGNDFFFVGATSRADDLGDEATIQAKRQFDAAPAYSIAPNQWPENASRLSLSLGAAAVPLAIGGGAFILIVLAAAVLVVVVLLTRRRPGAAYAAGALPAAGGLQMSEDGRYWWDGQAWRDAGSEVPPDALRSADGYYWWDSRTWRPVPPAPS